MTAGRRGVPCEGGSPCVGCAAALPPMGMIIRMRAAISIKRQLQ